MKLLIVESPTKAKTISKFLGKDYKVLSSFGHVKDLPKSKMGIDIDGGTFEPHYIVPRDKSKTVKELKDAAKKAKEIYLATDEDREGEAISWHLANILDIKPEEVLRLVFHEITPHAIKEALAHPRHLDLNLVNAQQARRVLDRLVGYELSPLLWKKVTRGLSAGRVQSVAVRLVVEREQEIKNFKPDEYWTITGSFLTKDKEHTIEAELEKKDGKRLDKLFIKNKEEADAICEHLTNADYHISDIKKKNVVREPGPPLRTSTLQQEANHKLGFSSKQTMRIAQQLYEGVELGAAEHVGLITYMRTDSLNLSEKFVHETQAFVKEILGENYTVKEPRSYAKKVKNAQEAHEAIRPTDPTRTPDSIKPHLTPQQFKLYDLIWRRAVATQMAAAQLESTTIAIENKNAPLYTFRAKGQTVVFDGYLKLYPEKNKEVLLPPLKAHEPLACKKLATEQHFTEPPARFSDATLVKTLEEFGIGRPSTYAPTIATIEDRGYVTRDEKKYLVPTEIAGLVNDLLVKHFPSIVDYQFTAKMEHDFDEIAEGVVEWQPLIKQFFEPFKKELDTANETIEKHVEVIDEKCPTCGNPLVVRFGRFGKFAACSTYPECKFTKNLSPEGSDEKPEDQTTDKKCPQCGKPLAVKRGRFGTFLGCTGYPECKYIEKQEKKTGAKCPQCGTGELIERRSKRGKQFFSCNRYPSCTFALWQRPTGEPCPNCQQPLVYKNKTTIKCSNADCSFEKPIPQTENTTAAE